jgi:hypothetical protein
MAYKLNYGPTGTTLVQVGTKFYLVYETEGKKLYWEIAKKELDKITDAGKISFDDNGVIATDIEGFQTVSPATWSNLQEAGDLWSAGLLTEIQDNEFEIDAAVNAIKTAALEMPWSNDSDYLNLVTEYIIEDRANWTANLTLDAEGKFGNILKKYDFSKDMYNRMITYKNDEVGRGLLVEDAKTKVLNMLNALEASLDADTVDWVANKYASASWSDTKLLTQLTAATQKFSIHETDDEFKKILEEGVTTFSNKGVEQVTNIIEAYLPVSLQQPYLDDIQNLAGKSISDATFLDTFTEKLKDERYAFNSSWDKDIPWINIKNNILSAAEKIWGVRPDENDTTIQQVMAINDVAKREKILRQEGLNRGYETVVNDLYSSMSQSFGTGIVKSLDYELNPGG